MKILNTGNKVIGIGDICLMPNETAEVPNSVESTVEVYERLNLVKVIDRGTFAEPAAEVTADPVTDVTEEPDTEDVIEADPEELKKQRLAALDSMSEEEVGSLARELGINPADCKDQKDVVKKVKAALKK